MNQLMETLFFALGTRMSEEEVQAASATRESIRTIEQRLTRDEFESLWDAISDIEHTSDLDSFIKGFRLGVQLTLEGLRPIS